MRLYLYYQNSLHEAAYKGQANSAQPAEVPRCVVSGSNNGTTVKACLIPHAMYLLHTGGALLDVAHVVSGYVKYRIARFNSTHHSQHSDQQNAQHCSLHIYKITQNTATCLDPQGTISREPTNATLYRTNLATLVYSRHAVKELNTDKPGYNDIGLYDIPSIASDILWYQLIPPC
jgi:hypothetical protein